MKIPEVVLSEFENTLCELKNFGTANLTVKIHDSHSRFEITSTKSIVPGKQTSGGKAEAINDD